MKTLLLEEMTWPQIRRAIEEGYKTVIVAAGSIEQHGKHLPIGTDTMLGYSIAIGIAEGLGHTLVAPVIRHGWSDEHLTFPGTISVSVDLLKELCRAYCRCLCRHGFERIVLIPTHGGNIQSMKEVAPELDAELPCRVVAPRSSLENPRMEEATDPILARYGVTREEGGLHSGFIETSRLLASPYGHLVNMHAAERGFVGDGIARIQEVKKDWQRDMADIVPNTRGWNMADITPIGVLGDPTKASVEAGRELRAASVAVYVEMVKEALG
jgi:creatinine amidohydrolase